MARISIRSRKKWLAVRKVVQIAALLVFIALVVMARRGGWPAELVNIPVRLDPLLMLAQALATRTVLVGSLLALIVIVLTIVFGRAWCGWLCPLGTTLDLFAFKRGRKKTAEVSDQWRAAKYVLLLTILIAALFGSLSLLFLDPISLTYRTFATAAWPAFNALLSRAEAALYPVPFLQPVIDAIENLRGTVLPPGQPGYGAGLLAALIFAGVLALNAVRRRFWCRYLCPLGALLGLASKLAVFRRRVSPACTSCARCARTCPTGTIDPAANFASDPAECTVCLDCVGVC